MVTPHSAITGACTCCPSSPRCNSARSMSMPACDTKSVRVCAPLSLRATRVCRKQSTMPDARGGVSLEAAKYMCVCVRAYAYTVHMCTRTTWRARKRGWGVVSGGCRVGRATLDLGLCCCCCSQPRYCQRVVVCSVCRCVCLCAYICVNFESAHARAHPYTQVDYILRHTPRTAAVRGLPPSPSPSPRLPLHLLPSTPLPSPLLSSPVVPSPLLSSPLPTLSSLHVLSHLHSIDLDASTNPPPQPPPSPSKSSVTRGEPPTPHPKPSTLNPKP